MFCVQCGVPNLHQGQFCHGCGEKLFFPPTHQVVTPASESAGETKGQPPLPLGVPHNAGRDRAWIVTWAVWSFAAAIIGLVGAVYANSMPSMIGLCLSGLLGGVAGVALLERAKVSLGLVWASTAAGLLGALFRGLKPIDLLGCALDLAFAFWLTKKTRLQYERLFRRTQWTSGVVSASVIVLVTMIMLHSGGTLPLGTANKLLSSNPLDNHLDKTTPASASVDASQIGKSHNDPFAAFGGYETDSRGRAKGLNVTDGSIDDGDWLRQLNPAWLVSRCGQPLSDTSTADLNGDIIETLSFSGSGGVILNVSFEHGAAWEMPRINRVPLKNDAFYLFNELPCLFEHGNEK